MGMSNPVDRLLNQSARRLALIGERMRATPYQCFLAEPIAVIGMGCRFPLARGPEAFWQLLVQGRDAIREVPPDRWAVDSYYDSDPQSPGKSYSRWGGFLDQVDEFDAALFGISPREARHMDPRQRILLETAWEALADGGLEPERLAGSRTGVFIGHMVGDYYSLEASNLEGIDSHVGTGNLDSILANRLSYVLNLQGPSLAVDTACSSSLVALHLACQSLRQDECSTALAGGVNLMLTPEMHVMGAKALLLSPVGRCKTFDRSADGFVRGEGCGVLVLKRLADALAADDRVLAIIRGIAVNQDGRTNGISAPNGLSQQRVIRQALHNALLEPARVTFVETHGTGTVIGDTIEFEALAEAYGGPGGDGPCYLGAVKTNVGHLEGAAGVAGVVKMVLCLQHRQIPPNLNFRELNPHLALGSTRFRLPREAEPWLVPEAPRWGAVSSFGLGGTNAHVILEEAPQATARDRDAGLPAPVFRRQRYWLPRREVTSEAAVRDLLCRLEWRPQPLQACHEPANAGDWLIVEPRAERGTELAERLKRAGQRAQVAGEYRPPPRGEYHGVVYLAGARDESDPPAEAEALSVGLLHLVQALGRAGATTRLCVGTFGSQAVLPSDTIRVGQASLWGLTRTIRFEHPEFNCVAIDLSTHPRGLDALVPELLSPGEPQVAYRNDTRYVARLVRDVREGRPPTPTIRNTGCYLITGGMGALGRRVARQLVQQGARHLILAGRTARPHDAAVEELRAVGASVVVVQANVSQAGDVKRLVETCARHGPLHGLVHAAGTLDDGVLENQTAERFSRVMAPKVEGAWELHRQTQALVLDFFVCFSSTASLLGSPGQGNYAAANAFLDALAHHRRSRGLAGLSINWGPWADAGMAAELRSRFEAHGEGMLEPEVGVQALTSLLAHPGAQVAVVRVNWTRYAATYPAPAFLELLLDATAGAGPSLRERWRQASADRRPELLAEFVRAQVGLVLGHPAEAVSPTQGFAALGMDSLGSIDLRTRLEQALGCRLPTTLAFDYPTVEALTAHLLNDVLPILSWDATSTPEAARHGADDLENMSREELAALLARELGTLQEGDQP
jgi:acyl transferase domain-containing protein/acyl carrier protein